MFVGRKKELKYLNDKYDNTNSEFIVIYGRRRIGKTELIKQFVKDKPVIFYSASEVDDYEQLGRFSRAISNFSNKNIKLRYDSWDDALLATTEYALDEKLVIVIDEFPYMVSSNKAVPSIIQNIWDHKLKDENIMFILSGSSVAFMLNDILGAKNPLYGRITGSYKLTELPIEDIDDFFPGYSMNDLITTYSILGGVPQYLLGFKSNLSIKENINKSILEKGARLYDEVNLLMKQELREPAVYFTLLEAIAMGSTKLNEIYQKTQIDKTKINAYLSKLIILDIIEREFPVTEKVKKKANVQSGLYKIKSNFFKFYYRFVFPNSSMLEFGGADVVYSQFIEASINKFVSSCYEELCRLKIIQMNILGRLPVLMNEIGRWWYKQAEIDIVGYNNRNQFIFGECKWKNEKVSLKDLNKLKTKINIGFSQVKVKGIYLFSKSGFTNELKELVKNEKNIQLIDCLAD